MYEPCPQKLAHADLWPESEIMFRYVTVMALAGFMAAPVQAQADAPVQVRATLIHLPRARACAEAGKVVTVMARYRLVEVLRGGTLPKQLLVAHRCPEYSRGPSRYGKGTATPLRVGEVHRMSLAARADGAFTPLRTDPGVRAPRVVVVVQGGGGTHHKLTFDTERLTVGSAPDADVRLADAAVASRHLQVRLTGDKLTISAVSSLGQVMLNGAPLARATAISFDDRVQLGSYTLRLALFLDPPEQS